MQGVRVVEVAEHTFAPSSGVVLADWGADVIKVERTVGGGDPARSLAILQRPGQKLNAYFEVANRGKRSIGLDLTQPEGREVLYKLVDGADVFITNLRGDARTKLGIESKDLMARNPRLIYARATGYGMEGPMASHGGFDFPSSWCRSGSGFVQTPATGGPPPQQPGSVGDLTGGATLAGAISAALFRRERTGKGCVVDHSLYGMGAYIMTQHITGASLAPPNAAALQAAAAPPGSGNAMVRLYKTKDNRWLNICLLQDRWFPDLARRMERAPVRHGGRLGAPVEPGRGEGRCPGPGERDRHSGDRSRRRDLYDGRDAGPVRRATRRRTEGEPRLRPAHGRGSGRTRHLGR